MPQQSRVPQVGVLALVLACLLAGCAPTVAFTPAPEPSTTRSPSAQPVFGDHGRQQYADGTARPIGGVYRYVVAAGDNIGGIAARFGTTQAAVAAASRGGFEIFEGDVLRITQ